MIDQLKKQMSRGGLSFKSVTAILIFGAIILVFVFFGLPTQQTGGGSLGSAARVNNTIISVADFNNEAQRLEQMYASLFGGQMSGDMQRQMVRGQALENLITLELIAQSASKQGIITTDAEVRDFIAQDITAFQKDGRFQRDLYYNYLQYSRLTASEFEDRIRKDRANQRTRRIFEASSVPLSLEFEKLKALKQMKLNVAFLALDQDAILAKKTVTKEQLDEKIKQLETAVNQGDEATINQVATILGIKWDETGFFDMSQDAIPKLSSPVLAQSAFELSEAQPLLKRLVRDGGTKYVLKLKSQKNEATTVADDLKKNIQRDRANLLFSKWIEASQKTSKIEKNNQVLQ